MTIKAITFDFWNTLISYGSAQDRDDQIRLRNVQMCETFRDFGYDFEVEELDRNLHQSNIESDERRFRGTREVTARWTIHLFLKKMNVKNSDIDLFKRLLAIYDDSLLEVGTIAIDGVPETLKEIYDMGIPIGLICNTGHGFVMRRLLDRFDLTKYFEILIFSDELGWRKPNKRIFREALARLGFAKPEQAIHVGDRMEFDVTGAKTMGIHAVFFDKYQFHPVPDWCPAPDFTIHEFPEVLGVIDSLNSKGP
jgi:HAD superfamily hydrolase (TIGR01549 family)